MRVGPSVMGLVLYRKGPQMLPGPLHPVRTNREVPSPSQKVSFHQNRPYWPLELGLPRCQDCKKWISVVSKMPSVWYFISAVQRGADSAPGFTSSPFKLQNCLLPVMCWNCLSCKNCLPCTGKDFVFISLPCSGSPLTPKSLLLWLQSQFSL